MVVQSLVPELTVTDSAPQLYQGMYLPGTDDETRRRLDVVSKALAQQAAQYPDAAQYVGRDVDLRTQVLTRYLLDRHGITDARFKSDIEQMSDFIVLTVPLAGGVNGR